MKTIAIFLGYEPYPKQGGMERVTDMLARMLSTSYKVILICLKKNRLNEVYTPPVPMFFLPLNDKTQQQQALSSLLSEHKVDFLIDQCEGAVIGRYGIFSRRSELLFPNLKCIAVQHSSAMTLLRNYHIVKQRMDLPRGIGWLYNQVVLPVFKQRAYRLQRALSSELNRNYDKIVNLSGAFIPHFHALAPETPQGKVVAISNPNTYEGVVTQTTGEKSVLFVGRLDNKAKGGDRLLRIWSRIEAHVPDWTLKVVGDGQDRTMLVDLASKLQLERVCFEGFRLPKPYYEKASIFCMTSTFEGFGMVLTEAMQHGVIPIAFDSYDALHDIVTDGKDGLIVPAFDEKQYAERLLALINNQEQLQQLSAEAMRASAKFSQKKIAQQWCHLIDSME